MRKRNISLIIGFMSVALLGVMAMQYYFIRESYRLKSQLFDQSVHEALNAVVYKVEKRSADNFMRRKALEKMHENDDPELIKNRIERFADRLKLKQLKIENDFRKRDSLLRAEIPRSIVVDNDFYETYIKNVNGSSSVRLQREIERSIDASGLILNTEKFELFVPAAEKKILKRAADDSIRYMDLSTGALIAMVRIDPELKAGMQEDLRQMQKEKRILDSINNVKQKPSSVFEDLAKDYAQANIPFEERVSPKFIDTLLRDELAKSDINLPYSYEIKAPNSRLTLFTNTLDKKDFKARNIYHATLFPKELVKQPGILTLIFPDKGNLILQNMSVTLISSATLLLVLVSCFAYTIFIILRQKKISEMKTDFINNMTHEFKTPVATIMIASEALKDPEVTEDASRIKRLAGIIYDENVRLGNHIERVLNIAKIDREDLKLDHEDIDMNDLIAAVVDSMDLQLQKKEIKLNMDLKAEHSMVKGDELHLSNVIFNLIDNAIKYSKDDPEIKISTYNSGKDLVILVRDNGIGMSRDQLSKIFEQFYRIPTGNLHDVKGFGLGLSYVSNIIRLLQGTIHVKSEKNKGSEFEVILRTS